jgi:hypothetical protein
MSSNFKIIETPVTGNIEITVDTQINHLDADTVIVAENVKARLYGTIHTKLILRKDSSVVLHGTIYGDLHNEGGELNIYEKNK